MTKEATIKQLAVWSIGFFIFVILLKFDGWAFVWGYATGLVAVSVARVSG